MQPYYHTIDILPGLEVGKQHRHPITGERGLLPAQRREVVLLVALALLVVLAVPDEEDVPRRLRRELGHLADILFLKLASSILWVVAESCSENLTIGSHF